MSRLIHLNGPPGIGKSTLARRYVDAYPGVLNCDIDVLRSLIGGWERDFGAAGALIRPAALAMIEAYLANGNDVILPQMLLDPGELTRFEACATRAGAEFIERFLMDSRDSTVARFHRRGTSGDEANPWHAQVRAIVATNGGDAALARCHAALESLSVERANAVKIMTVEGEIEESYRALLNSMS